MACVHVSGPAVIAPQVLVAVLSVMVRCVMGVVAMKPELQAQVYVVVPGVGVAGVIVTFVKDGRLGGCDSAAICAAVSAELQTRTSDMEPEKPSAA